MDRTANVLVDDRFVGRIGCSGFVDGEKGERSMAIIGNRSSDSVGSARYSMELIQSGCGDVV
ncbi:MAG: hypothetical protein CBC13_02140 [Planctomycetia bacterium TMED53]|nr:MAG: hypothetical protein CBC13_02140 [Planctomycetia bacterium TMED53]